MLVIAFIAEEARASRPKGKRENRTQNGLHRSGGGALGATHAIRVLRARQRLWRWRVNPNGVDPHIAHHPSPISHLQDASVPLGLTCAVFSFLGRAFHLTSDTLRIK